MSITLQTVSSGYNLSVINNNFQRLEDALNSNLLWRTGSVAGETKMSRDLDMDGHNLLNIGTDLSLPGSLITVGQADLRYYNVAGDTLEGDMDAGEHKITSLAAPSSPTDAARKKEVDEETSARQNADASLQAQITGDTPLEASAFSQISWHAPNIPNSVTIPPNKNAWSFGPQMEVEEGQVVTVSEGSSWTIADGRLVEDEDLHQLIAGTIRTPDGSVVVDITDVGKASDVSALASRMSTEEAKVQSVAKGGTGATTAAGARTALDAFQNTGVTDASNAATGKVGEFLSNTGTAANAVSGSVANYATLTLTPGDWEVSGGIQANPTGQSSAWPQLNASISLTSGTGGGFPYLTIIRTSFNANGGQAISTPIRRVSVSASTPVYLVAGASFQDGTMPIQGFIQARRIR